MAPTKIKFWSSVHWSCNSSNSCLLHILLHIFAQSREFLCLSQFSFFTILAWLLPWDIKPPSECLILISPWYDATLKSAYSYKNHVRLALYFGYRLGCWILSLGTDGLNRTFLVPKATLELADHGDIISVYLNATIGHSGLVTARQSLHTVEQGTQYPSNVHNKTKRSSGDDNWQTSWYAARSS